MPRAARIAVGLAVTGAIVAAILTVVPLRRIGAAFGAFDPIWLVPLSACYLATFAVRAARFQALGIPIPMPALFGVVSVYQFLVRVMPFRSGEAAFPVLARRVAGVRLTRGVAAVALSHLLDLAALAVAMLGSLLAAPDIRETLGPAWTALAIGGLGAAAATYFVFPPLAIVLADRLSGAFASRRQVLAERLRGASETLGQVRAISRRSVGRSAALTALGWIAALASFRCAAAAVGIAIDLPHLVLGAAAAVLAGVLPIGGVGNFGTFEGAWAAGFVLAGIDSGAAVASALVMSATTFLIAGAAAGTYLLVSRAAETREDHTSPHT